MKRLVTALAIVAVVGVIAAAAGIAVIHLAVHSAPSDRAGEVVRFEVNSGDGLKATLRRLQHVGVVEKVWPLRWYAWITQQERGVKLGTYEFEIGASAREVFDRLVAGDILRVAVTVPEGKTMWEIAGAFKNAGIDSSQVLAAIKSRQLREKFGIDSPSLEGYLFPDTYHVRYGATAEEAVTIMIDRLGEVYNDAMHAEADSMGMTQNEVLTLASIIEAEARVGSERRAISAVYHNRLERGIKLEADPTVAYAMGGYRGRLLYADLEIDSPYNTYRNVGLPPGPICSPGEATIRAALNPEPGVNALFFVARGDGSHVFSRTLAEHNRHVQALRKVQRQQRRELQEAKGN